MSTVIISLEADRTTGTTPYDTDSWVCQDVEFLVENPYQSRSGATRSRLYFHGSDNVSNQPVPGKSWSYQATQGACAYLVPQASVISARPRQPAPAVALAIGDLVVVPSMDVVLRVISGGPLADTKLEVLACPPATIDHSDFVAAARDASAARRA